MFNLYIMRHAESDPARGGLSDFERPLNQTGQTDAKRIGEQMRDECYMPQAMIVSPALRARQTAKLLIQQFAAPPEMIQYEKMLYLADLQTLIELIMQYKENVSSLMMIAHNPSLSQLFHYLQDNDENIIQQDLAPANLAVFEFADDFNPTVDKAMRLVNLLDLA